MPKLKINKPGFQTTVQDCGRFGYAHFGVSASGAADHISLRIGNLLVGNDENAAGLEMTLVGGEFEFDSETVVAVTGSDFQPTLDGAATPVWSSVPVHKGQTLRLSNTEEGARCYLCVNGGIQMDKVMGGLSTHLLSGIGGYKGRSLQGGDILKYLPLSNSRPKLKRFNPNLLGTLKSPTVLRVTEGPQRRMFVDPALDLLVSSPYRVTEESNRMGIRFAGEPIPRLGQNEMITEGASLGALQISHDGQPIILFVEHQTTGGYPKIANVISADLHLVGQLRPRDEVRFKLVTMDQAYSELMKLESIVSPGSFLPA